MSFFYCLWNLQWKQPQPPLRWSGRPLWDRTGQVMLVWTGQVLPHHLDAHRGSRGPVSVLVRLLTSTIKFFNPKAWPRWCLYVCALIGSSAPSISSLSNLCDYDTEQCECLSPVTSLIEGMFMYAGSTKTSDLQCWCEHPLHCVSVLQWSRSSQTWVESSRWTLCESGSSAAASENIMCVKVAGRIHVTEDDCVQLISHCVVRPSIYMYQIRKREEEEDEQRGAFISVDMTVPGPAVWSPVRYLCSTMNVSLLLPSLLLLLAANVCDQTVGAVKLEPVGPVDQGSRLRGLWKLHVRDSMLRRKGERAPGNFSIQQTSSFLYLFVHRFNQSN